MKSLHYNNKAGLPQGSAGLMYLFPSRLVKEHGALAGIAAMAAGKCAVVADAFIMKKYGAKPAASFDQAAEKIIFAGEVTPAEFFRIKSLAAKSNIATLVALGGGKCMDICKLVKRDLPGIKLIAVPTSAATCAAFTSVAVMYDKTGFYMDTLETPAPDVVVIDYDVMEELPEGFFAAGAIDAISKYYETAAAIPRSDKSAEALMALSSAKELKNSLSKIIRQKWEKGLSPSDKCSLAELNIIYSGIVSCAGKTIPGGYIAHALANAATCSKGAKEFLHGEQVGVALLVQEEALKNKKNCGDIAELMKIMAMPQKFSQLGVAENEMDEVTAAFKAICSREKIGFPAGDELMYNVINKYY